MKQDLRALVGLAGEKSSAEGKSSAIRELLPRPGKPSRRITVGFVASRFGWLVIWLALIVIFAAWTPGTFLTGATIKSVAGEQAITGLLALAVLIPLAAGVFDLSIAQNLGLSAVVVGALISWLHFNPVAAALTALVIGVAIGVVNGFLVAVVGVNSFIATLGMQSVLLAATEAIANGQYLGPFPNSFETIGSASPLGIPIVTIYLFALGILAWWLLEHSPLGRRTYATGASPDAARLAGIRTKRYVLASYIVCGFGGSLAGVLLSAQVGSVSQDIGPPYLLPAYAACFLGATQLKPGRFNVWGTLIALYLLATGVKGLQLVGAATWITDLFNGIALVVAVSVVVLGQKARARKTPERTHEQ
jgi:ribose transport system permease protein